MHLRGLRFQRQQSVPIQYKEVKLGSNLRLDLIVEEKVIVDIKAQEQLSAIDKPQMLTYLRLRGMIINFHVKVLRDGIYRVVNKLKE